MVDTDLQLPLGVETGMVIPETHITVDHPLALKTDQVTVETDLREREGPMDHQTDLIGIRWTEGNLGTDMIGKGFMVTPEGEGIQDLKVLGIYLNTIRQITNEPCNRERWLLLCAASDGLDQPAHPNSLIRAVTVPMSHPFNPWLIKK